MQHKLWTLVPMLLAVSLISVACGRMANAPSSPQGPAGEVTAATGQPAPTSAVRPPKARRFVISQIEETRDLRSIDPLVSMDIPIPSLLVYDTLLRRTPSGELKPWLAESFERTDDLTWQFKLRRGVKFSDGSPLTSADVKATIDHIMNPKARSGLLRMISYVKDMRVLDDYTVAVVTKVPHVLQPNFLVPIPILSDEQLSKGDDAYKTNLIGTGPYLLAEWRPAESVLLKKNPQYWAGPVEWDEVLVKAVDEPFTRLADLLSGTAQLSGDLLPDTAPRLKQAGFQAVVEPGVRTAYMAFVFKPPLNDSRIRRAIYHAIDRRSLAEALFGNLAIPATSVVPPSFGGYAEVFPLSDYNPQRSRDLLKEARAPTPLRVDIDIWAMMSSAAQLVQAQLKDVGIELKINIMDRAAVFDAKRLNSLQEGHIGMITALDNHMFDALRPYEAFVGSGSFLKTNGFGYQPDPANEALIQQYMAEASPAKRKLISQKIMENIKEEMPVIWLYFPDLLYGAAPSTEWRGSGVGRIEIRDIKAR